VLISLAAQFRHRGRPALRKADLDQLIDDRRGLGHPSGCSIRTAVTRQDVLPMSDLLQYRPSESAIYYKPPRRVDWGRLSWGFAIALVLTIGGSIAYGRVLPKIDDAFGRIGAVIAAALAVGVLGVIAVRVGRVRIPVLAASLGAVISIVALYVMWFTWTASILARAHWRHSPAAVLLNPVMFSRIIFLIGKSGTWMFKGDLVNGVPLYLLWMGEAGLIVAAGTLLPIAGLYSDEPVCAGCGRRCVRAPGFPRFSARNQAEFLSAIEGRNFDSLAGFAAPENADAPELSVKVMSCPDCGTTHVLTVSWVGWVAGKGQRPMVKVKPLINQQLITGDESASLSAVMERIRKQRNAPQPPQPPGDTHTA
jgi:hypothetical protein